MTPTIDAELVLDVRAEVGEGPAWDAHGARLVWVDILRSSVHELRQAGRAFRTRTWRVSEHVGAAVPRAGGGLLLASTSGFSRLDERGRERRHLKVEANRPENRMNDGKCDPQGRLWAGTMPYDEGAGGGALYRLDPDGTVHTILTDVGLSNGMGWSPDGGTFYYIDTPTQRVGAYDFDSDSGQITNARSLLTIEEGAGRPDGMTVDDEGHLWVALFGGGEVRRYTPEGKLDAVVPLPASQVTNCAFGGPDLDELYITTAARGRDDEPRAGGLFRCRPGVTGPPATPFAG